VRHGRVDGVSLKRTGASRALKGLTTVSLLGVFNKVLGSLGR